VQLRFGVGEWELEHGKNVAPLPKKIKKQIYIASTHFKY
jgi:hypothetical protein